MASTQRSEPAFSSTTMGRVLLVEPWMFIHTPDYIRAAMSSHGFAQTRFTLVIGVVNDLHLRRLSELEKEFPGLEIITVDHQWIKSRRDRVRYTRACRVILKKTEELLANRQFDLVVYFMIDHVFPFLALPFAKWRYPQHWAVGGISGSVFRANGIRPPVNSSLKERIKNKIDRWTFQKAVKGGWFRKLAFLDHHNVTPARELTQSDACICGVDPIELNSLASEEARQRLGLPINRKVVLLFGAISWRKAVPETLDLLTHSEQVCGENVTILIGGPVDEATRVRLAEAIARARAKFEIVHHDGFVPDDDLPAFFAAADLVACAYIDFIASSGTLLHAAAAGKPALVSEGGVMDDAVRKYQCGEVVSFSRPEEFAAAFNRLLHADAETAAIYQRNALRYAETMDSRRYLGCMI